MTCRVLQQSQASQRSLVVMKEKPEWDFDAFCLGKVFECVQVLMVNNQSLWWTDREMSSSFSHACLIRLLWLWWIASNQITSQRIIAYLIFLNSWYQRKKKRLEKKKKRPRVCRWYMGFTMSAITLCSSHYSAVFKQQKSCLPPVGDYLFNYL